MNKNYIYLYFFQKYNENVNATMLSYHVRICLITESGIANYNLKTYIFKPPLPWSQRQNLISKPISLLYFKLLLTEIFGKTELH